MIPADSDQKRLGFGPILWALIPVLSFGLLAFLPFAHAAVKLPNRRMWLITAAYGVATIVVAGPLAAVSNTGDLGSLLFTAAWFGLVLVAAAHAFLLRRRVFAPVALQPALVAALAGRRLREQARAIAAGDPALARELRIGRPDLPRQFDDGGLIDINHVPAPVLMAWLGLSQAETTRVIEARSRLGGFTGPAEACAYAEIPDATIEALRDRLLFLTAG
jgi:hypothetical protein